MGLKEFDWRRKYRSDDGLPLSETFFKPAISLSKEYNRGTGYFSSSLFKVLGDEIQDFLETREGEFNIVTNVELSEKDYHALQQGSDISRIVKSRIDEIIRDDFVPPITDGAKAMISLLEIGRLKLKIAITKKGIYHEKIGYFKDEFGDIVAWEGSPNDGQMALENNFENIKVFTSWEPVKSDYCKDTMSDFQNLWSENTSNLRIIPFPQASAEDLIRIKKVSKEIEDEAFKKKRTEKKFKEKQSEEKWKHQDEAVRLFLEPINSERSQPPMPAGGRGILCMATGTGKTRTACKLIQRMIDDNLIDNVIITTQFTDILDQWSKEIDERLSFIMQYSHYRDNRESADYEESSAPNAALLCSREVFSRILESDSISHNRTLLIIDECHNFRGEGHIDRVGHKYSKFRYKLGLSATPYSPYSDEVNQAMELQIGPTYFMFGIQEAIGKRILTPFNYDYFEFELTDEERDKLIATRRSFEKKIKDGKATKEQMMVALSRIYKLSKSKIPIFNNLLKQNPFLLRRCIIFVETMEYGKLVMKSIINYGGEYREKWHSYFASDEIINLEKFRKRELECLVTCKKLNEGVDIPSITTIIMFSSEHGANGLSTTQRIGRALRYVESEPNKISQVYDFVRMDTTQGRNDYERRRWLQDLSTLRPPDWRDE